MTNLPLLDSWPIKYDQDYSHAWNDLWRCLDLQARKALSEGWLDPPTPEEWAALMRIERSARSLLISIWGRTLDYLELPPDAQAGLACLYPAAVRIAVLATMPEVVADVKRRLGHNAPEALWYQCLAENMRGTVANCPRIRQALDARRKRLRRLSGKRGFRELVEQDWEAAGPHHSGVVGFVVPLVLSPQMLVEYLRTNPKSPIAREMVDYLTELRYLNPFHALGFDQLRSFVGKCLQDGHAGLAEGEAALQVRRMLRQTRGGPKSSYADHLRTDLVGPATKKVGAAVAKYDPWYGLEGPTRLRFVEGNRALALQPDARFWEPALYLQPVRRRPGQVAFTHYAQRETRAALEKLCGTGPKFGPATNQADEETLADLNGSINRGNESEQGNVQGESQSSGEREKGGNTTPVSKKTRRRRPSHAQVDPDGTKCYLVGQFIELIEQRTGLLVSVNQLRHWARDKVVTAQKSQQTGKGFARGKRYWLFRDDAATMAAVHQLASGRRAQPSAPEGCVARSRIVELSDGAISLRRLRYLEQTGTLTSIKQQDRVYYSIEQLTPVLEKEKGRRR